MPMLKLYLCESLKSAHISLAYSRSPYSLGYCAATYCNCTQRKHQTVKKEEVWKRLGRSLLYLAALISFVGVSRFMLMAEMMNQYFSFFFGAKKWAFLFGPQVGLIRHCWTLSSTISFSPGLGLLSIQNTQLFTTMSPQSSQVRWCGATILPIVPRSSHAHDRVSAVFVSTCQRNVSLSLRAFRSVWQDMESELGSVNFRRVSDSGRAFQLVFGVSKISDGWSRNTIRSNCNKFGNILRWHRSLGAPGIVSKPIRESQTTFERYLGALGCWFWQLQVLSETLHM